MDVPTMLIGAAIFLFSAILIYLISKFAMSERTYEEVMREQKARLEGERTHKAPTGEKKEKARGKMKQRRSKTVEKTIEKTTEVIVSSTASKVEEEPPIVVPPPDTSDVGTVKQRKAKKSPQPAPVPEASNTSPRKQAAEKAPISESPIKEVKAAVAEAQPDVIMVTKSEKVKAAPPVAEPQKNKEPESPSADVMSADNAKIFSLVQSTSFSSVEVTNLIAILNQKSPGTTQSSAKKQAKSKEDGETIKALKSQLAEKERMLKEERECALAAAECARVQEAELISQREHNACCERASEEQSAAHALELHALRVRSQANEDRMTAEVTAARNETGQHRAVLHKLMEENQKLTEAQSGGMPAADIMNMKQQLKIMEGELKKNVLKMNGLEAQKKSLESKNTEFRDKISRLEISQRDADSTLRHQLSSVSEELLREQSNVSQLQAQLTAADQERARTSDELATLRSTLQAMDNNRPNTDDLLARLQMSEQEKSRLQTEVEALEEKLAQQYTTNADNANTLQRLDEANRQLSAELNERESAYQQVVQPDTNTAPMLEVEMVQMRADISEKTTEIERLQQLVERETNRNNEMNLKKEGDDKEMDAMRSSLQDMSVQLEKAKADLDSTRDEMRLKSENGGKEVYELKSSLEDMTSELDKARAELKELTNVKEQFDVQNASYQQLEQQYASLKSENQDLRLGCEEATRTLTQAEKSAEAVELVQQQLTEKVDEVARLQAQLTDKNSELGALQAQLTDRGSEDSLLQTQLEQRSSEMARLETLLSERDTEVSRLKESLEEHTTKVTALEASLEAQSSSQDINSNLEEMSSKIASLEASLAQKSTEVTNLQSALTEKSSELSDLHTSLTQKSSDFTSLEDTLTQKSTDVTSLEATLAQKSSEVTNLEATLAQKSSDVTSLEATLTQKSTEVTSLEATLAQKSSEVTNLEATLAQKSSEVTSLEATLTQKSTEVTNLEATLAQKSSEVTNLETTVGDKSSELVRLQSLLDEKLALISQLQSTATTTTTTAAADNMSANPSELDGKEFTTFTRIEERSSLDVSRILADLDTKSAELTILQAVLAQKENQIKELEGQIESNSVVDTTTAAAPVNRAESVDEQEIEKLREIVKGYWQENTSLTDRLEEMETKVKDDADLHASEVARLKQQLNTLKEELASESIKQQEEQEVKDDSQKTSEAEHKLQLEVQHYKAVLADTEGILRKLQKSIESEECQWQQKLISSDRQLQSAKDEVYQLREQMKTLQGSSELKEKNRDLQQQLTDNTTVAELQQRLVEEQQKLDEVTSMNSRLKGMLKTGEDALREEQDTVKELREKLTSQNTVENGTTYTEVEQLRARLAQLEEELSREEHQRKALAQKLDASQPSDQEMSS